MAQEDNDTGEKQFDATEQRLQQARRDGDVAQSKEANGLAVVLGMAVVAILLNYVAGASIFSELTAMLYHADAYAEDVFNSEADQTIDWAQRIVALLGPAFVALVGLVLLALVAQRSINFSAKSLKPDLNKLSPVENLKKKYGARGITDFAKDGAKMIFAGIIAVSFLYGFVRSYYASSAVDIGRFAAFTFEQIFALIMAFVAFQFVLAAIDLPLQRQLHADRLKMSREDLKKEVKQSEGDPQLKQSRRKMASDLSSGKMMDNVKSSTVVMVNPEHYAVALKWDPDSGKAPICVAKGVDHLAASIRDVATAAGVPIYRDPPSTRSIYRLVDIDEEIHPEHFAAVAAAVQYVDRVRRHFGDLDG